MRAVDINCRVLLLMETILAPGFEIPRLERF